MARGLDRVHGDRCPSPASRGKVRGHESGYGPAQNTVRLRDRGLISHAQSFLQANSNDAADVEREKFLMTFNGCGNLIRIANGSPIKVAERRSSPPALLRG